MAKTHLPSYSHLQDMIGAALAAEDRRLIEMMKHHLKKRASNALENLFKMDDGFYRITELKLDAKSFQTKEMEGEIEKLILCRPIYAFAKKFLSVLGLSRGMIEHYAGLARLYNAIL